MLRISALAATAAIAMMPFGAIAMMPPDASGGGAPDSIDDLVARLSALESTVSSLGAQVSALSEQVANLPVTTAGAAVTASADDEHRTAWVDTVLHKWFANDAPPNPVASPSAASVAAATDANGTA